MENYQTSSSSEEEFDEMAEEMPDIANERIALTGDELDEVIENTFQIESRACELANFRFGLIGPNQVCNVLCLNNGEAHWILIINHGHFYSYLDTYGRTLKEIYNYYRVQPREPLDNCYAVSKYPVQNDYSVVCGYYSIICCFLASENSFDLTAMMNDWERMFINTKGNDPTVASTTNDMMCLLIITEIVPNDVINKTDTIIKHLNTM